MKKPDYIRTGDDNSFAFFTLTRRLPSIVRSVIENNNFDNEINDKLECLFAEIPEAELKPLPDSSDVNRKMNAEIREQKYRWNDAPFIFAENYLYHRLKEICNYSGTKYDYFAFKKDEDVLSKKEILLKTIEDTEKLFAGGTPESFNHLMHFYLSGNTADLSQTKTIGKNNITLLIDDTEKTRGIFNASNQIDIVLDNSGEELFYDILFSHWILSKTNTKTVNLHFKTFPYFVSDAMIKDFHFLLWELSADKRGGKFCNAIYNYISRANVVLYEDDYWTDTNDFSIIPENIKRIFSKSDIIIFKGDLNYRKLAEDRHWNHNTETKEIITYKQNNCLIIRVLKSEIITNLNNIPGAGNNEWMYNGRFGIIQLVDRC